MIWQGLIFGMTTMALGMASQAQAINYPSIIQGGVGSGGGGNKQKLKIKLSVIYQKNPSSVIR